jgi:outer membrane protein assembly factor BamB
MTRLLNFFKQHRTLRRILAGVIIVLVIGYLLGSPEESHLYALNMQDGRVAWSVAASSDLALWGSLAIANGRVFVASATNPPVDKLYAQYPWKLTAYSTDTGSRLWEYTADQTLLGQISASILPVPGGEHIFVTIVTEQQTGRLLALDAANGTLRWAVDGLHFPSPSALGLSSYFYGQTPYAAYAVAGSTLYAVLTPDTSDSHPLLVTALDAATGAKRWATAFGEQKTTLSVGFRAVFASEKTVYVSAEDKMYTFDAQNGEVQASSGTDTGIVIMVDGVLYRRDQQNRIVAQDAATGDLKWQFAPPKDDSLVGCFNLNADTQRVYAFCELKGFNKDLPDSQEADPLNWTGVILGLDAGTGREIWRKTAAYVSYTLARQTPLLGQGLVGYVGGSSDNYHLTMRAQTDGSERWSFAVHDGSGKTFSDGEHVYVTDRASRLQHWLALLNPLWH